MASAPIYSYSAAPSTTQAGGHPNLLTSFEFGTTYNQGYPNKCLCDDPENITNNLATGVIGDPNNVPKCTQANFDQISSERRSGNCSTDSQVGVAVVGILGNHIPEPVFNVEPDPHQAALLGFWLPIAAVPAFIVLKARTGGDFGLDAELSGIEHIIAPESFELDLWGVPADPIHDSERSPPGSSGAELKPFLDNPTTCNGPQSTSLEIFAYDGETATANAPWPATTGCDQLSFNPSLYAQPTTTGTDAASGWTSI